MLINVSIDNSTEMSYTYSKYSAKSTFFSGLEKIMLLSELHKQIEPHFTPSLQKDLKTAVKTLATVLNSNPEQCPLEKYNRPLPELYGLIETHLRDKGRSPNTVRNVKNNVSRMFRYAEDHSLLTIKPAIPVRTIVRAGDLPRRPESEYERVKRDGSMFRFHSWPENLVEEWETFYAWATDPVVEGRDARLRKRPITLQDYQTSLERFFGYLAYQRHFDNFSFNQLFDFDLIHDYVLWHVNEKHKTSTVTIFMFLKNCTSLANQYRVNPELKKQLNDLKRTLPTPGKTYDKKKVWVSLADIRRVGNALWPSKRPEDIVNRSLKAKATKGVVYATRAGFSIIFRLWTFRPYRQRNIREMKLDENLYKDTDGNWRIKFVGEQLKVAAKKGKINIFDLPFPTELVPDLETYLNVWRPILAGQADHKYSNVFLTKYGTPWIKATNFYQPTKLHIHRYLGKHFNPHMIRTVWATEWIKNTHGDFYTAAVMLNDKLETVIANYSELLEEDVAEKADRFITERIKANGSH